MGKDCGCDFYEGVSWVLIVLFLIGLVAFVAFTAQEANRTEELGQAICSEKKDAVFDRYEEGIVYCKNQKVEPYDGILISVNDLR